ncbi:phosphohistidine phosphatase SixA [Idiomarina tyrosinivorans]|uniref:Phosphohistidine phosphatase SixA n=1 Tax=Idiomarina tyrosinivorans TaxID=1445662 RepID=A0A432ZRI7_9GAMM|nr:phosphohistidine phosphatase SixA [Idiomarina tyrosinivorans]RUO80509.1 phosphohistidine phosphatase SixA [Idiomarina tyrosinivorans]
MKLFIMRHGEAEPDSVDGYDNTRRLTALGEREVRESGAWFAEHFGAVDCAFVSPYLRAQQTADVVSEQWQLKQRQTVDTITPDADVDSVVSWLMAEAAVHGFEQLLLVSHMPLVSYLVSALDARVAPPIFPTAGVAVIDVDVNVNRGCFQRLVSTDALQR